MKTNLLLLLLFFIFLNSCNNEFENDNKFLVIEIIDGDTIKLDDGEVVRLLGIDAPERREEGYYAAADRLRKLVENKEVVLIPGNNSNRDRYGRLLRYIYIEGRNESVNDIMLREGYAVAYKR